MRVEEKEKGEIPVIRRKRVFAVVGVVRVVGVMVAVECSLACGGGWWCAVAAVVAASTASA